MFLLLILPILVSGFIVCNTNPVYFYKLHRYEGQYLYLKSAHLGLVSLTVFSLIAFLLSKFLPPVWHICKWDIPVNVISLTRSLLLEASTFQKIEDLNLFTWIIVISLGTILYAYFWSSVSKIRLRFKAGSLEKSKILLVSKVLNDSPLDKLLFESYINSRPLLLTLDTRKVYVGTISSLGEPNESEGMDQEISIIPVISGYRDKDSLKVEFITHYDIVDSDLNIVIRQDQVITASWFDFDIYKKLNP
ncbi:hypothetical protein MNBD_GAMMA12-1351 [hydrothermal vent metagenome]|uniref:Uncharacterized protein n=1 Tax=hydrothermal vent metagenome TaxID=652676 RepID=A0A3B0YKF1_9ZZZZ